MNRVFDNFTEAYISLAGEIKDNYDFISSPRGMKVKEKLGVRFEIKNPRERIPYVPARKFKIQYMIAETLWYFSANNHTEWIANYAPFWRDISDDGVTANSAYGSRIFRHHPRIAGERLVQWNYVKDELKRDPDSRRAIIHIKTAEDSLSAKKDVPCTLALQFFIRDNKLNLVVNMRSSDLILGIAYDVPAFTYMQEMMAIELGIELGSYIHVSNSLHVYERHFDMLDEIASVNTGMNSLGIAHDREPMPAMPAENLSEWAIVYQLENELRNCKDRSGVERILRTGTSLHSYWRDWLAILASHRLLKLGEKQAARDNMNSVHESLRPIRRNK